MIPASYLFRNTYRQHWEEPEVPVVAHRNSRFFDGLTTPLAGAIRAVLAHHPTGHEHRFGGHAYE
jgi:hypothetical protein